MSVKTPKIHVHNTMKSSRANGPGNRAVIWLQGCEFKCPGCFNSLTHPLSTPTSEMEVSELIDLLRIQIDAGRIEGITFSGGEPLLQWDALQQVLQWIHRNRPEMTVIIFTGYTRTELQIWDYLSPLIDLSDVIIAGRYDRRKRIANGLIGSSNKEVIFCTDRYSMADLIAVPAAEVVIRNGEIILSGIDPATL